MNRTYRLLIPIILILVIAIIIDLPNSPVGKVLGRDISTHLGLDLVGGVQALLEADVPANTTVSAANMAVAKQIVENRVNSLGVNEPLVQQAGSNRIVVELPGETDPETALAVIRETGLLEFVDMTSLTPQQAAALIGTKIKTDYTAAGSQPSSTPTATPITPGAAPQTPEIGITPSAATDHNNHLYFTGPIGTNFSYRDDRSEFKKCPINYKFDRCTYCRISIKF